MPGMREMTLEKAWKIFQKRKMYDDVHAKYALDRLVKEIVSHMGGAVCPDIELHFVNDAWYGVFEERMMPITDVLEELRKMKKPDGSVMRIRVFRPQEG